MLQLRPIRREDNFAVSQVIRTVMTEFHCIGEGFSINDPEVNDMHAAYPRPQAGFFVLTDPEDRIVGVGGYGPLTGGDGSTCELRKMYLLPAARGQGAGLRLLQHCLQVAAGDGYERMYLETVAGMKDAAALYARNGFTPLPGPLGSTGHCGCDRYMVRDLS